MMKRFQTFTFNFNLQVMQAEPGLAALGVIKLLKLK